MKYCQEEEGEACQSCQGDGRTPANKVLKKIVQDLVWTGSSDPQMIALTTGLCGRSPVGRFGHDSVDEMEARHKIIQAAGLDPEAWGLCPTCKGEGSIKKEPDKRLATGLEKTGGPG